MPSNKLMEAAAEILSGSKKTAPAMPPEKLPGESQDLGGPTPQNSKPDDDSNKIHTGKSADHSAKNKASIAAKPSAASGDTQLKLGGGKKEMHEDEELEDDDVIEERYISNKDVSYAGVGGHSKKDLDNSTMMHRKANLVPGSSVVSAKRVKNSEVDAHKKDGWYHPNQKANEEVESFREDIDAMFADDETISEDFKNKAFTIFEARVHDRVSQIEEQLETEYAGMLEEAVEQIKTDLTEKVDDYLNYVVEQWMEENQLAIESGLRAELAEEFIAGLRNLFAEHYVDVPAEKVDLVDELATKVEELESKLNEEMERNIEFSKALVESYKAEVTRQVCEGLTTTQFEKIKSLAESVDYSTEEEYKEKIETIRENYFPSGIKKADVAQLHEQVEDTQEKKAIHDPFVAAVSQAISKTKI